MGDDGEAVVVNLILKIFSGFKEYRELFLGGGSTFIRLKQNFSNKSFWVNIFMMNFMNFGNAAKKI
jgi:DNA adenine methylase